MDSLRAFDVTPPSGTPGTHSSQPDRPAADALAAAIRRPLGALESAAEEAEAGMLGAAKLGLLVATNRADRRARSGRRGIRAARRQRA